jgi:hypothetical protein
MNRSDKIIKIIIFRITDKKTKDTNDKFFEVIGNDIEIGNVEKSYLEIGL